MEAIMRTTMVQGLLCLVGINSPLQCLAQNGGLNWKNGKNVHFELTRALNKKITTTRDLNYFGVQIANDRHFAIQLNKTLIPRPVDSPEHEEVRQNLINEMRRHGWFVESPTFAMKTPHGVKDFSNVIATLDPRASRRMVIACHYDSLIKPVGFLGATDSAVPCAMMLNMAKTMKRELKLLRNFEEDLTLQFIFFDGEEAFVRWNSEDSIYGSRYMAADLAKRDYAKEDVEGNLVEGTELDRIDIFVLLDLIGAKGMSLSKLETSTGEWYDRLYAIEDNLLRKRLMTGGHIFEDRFLPAGIEDDHIPFKRRGVPILHLIAYPFPKAWHKMGDNYASLDLKKISNLNKILRVFVAEYLHLVDHNPL